MSHLPNETGPYLLRGLIKCGYCGHPLVVSGTSYRCHSRVDSKQECRGVSIPTDTIDPIAWDYAMNHLENSRTIVFSNGQEATHEEKRRTLKMLGVTVLIYREKDTTHDHYEINHSLQIFEQGSFQ
jgi:hypothetical protein